MKIQVLNGEIEVGDKVAFAVREGNQAAIRTGEVVDIVDTGRERTAYSPQDGYRLEPVLRVKIRVEHTSGWTKVGSVVGVEIHKRIVKLGGRSVTPPEVHSPV